MVNLSTYIIEKYKFNKSSLSNSYIIEYRSSREVDDIRESLLRMTHIKDIDIIKVKQEENRRFIYQLTVYNIYDLLELFMYLFDWIEFSSKIKDIDVSCKRNIIDYENKWQDFVHKTWSDDELRDAWLKYCKHNGYNFR